MGVLRRDHRADLDAAHLVDEALEPVEVDLDVVVDRDAERLGDRRRQPGRALVERRVDLRPGRRCRRSAPTGRGGCSSSAAPPLRSRRRMMIVSLRRLTTSSVVPMAPALGSFGSRPSRESEPTSRKFSAGASLAGSSRTATTSSTRSTSSERSCADTTSPMLPAAPTSTANPSASAAGGRRNRLRDMANEATQGCQPIPGTLRCDARRRAGFRSDAGAPRRRPRGGG